MSLMQHVNVEIEALMFGGSTHYPLILLESEELIPSSAWRPGHFIIYKPKCAARRFGLLCLPNAVTDFCPDCISA